MSSPIPLSLLATTTRFSLRTHFSHSLSSHQTDQFVFPYHVLLTLFLPALWLLLPPHAHQSPWARYMTAGIIVAANTNVIMSTSSAEMGSGYICGVVGCWGILSGLGLLVWRRPEVDAARIVRRVKVMTFESNVVKTSDGAVEISGRANRRKGKTVEEEEEEDAQQEQEYEYFWQPFPRNGPFLERLNWILDMLTNFRLIGWNWSIPTVPTPSSPPSHGPFDQNTPIGMSSIEITSKAGITRPLTESQFLYTRLKTLLITYLILDLFAVVAVSDPYFILGPDTPYHHPTTPKYLTNLPPIIVQFGRQIMVITCIAGMTTGIFNLNDLANYYVFSKIFPMRKELWQYPSHFGSPVSVLHRGLAGAWGQLWHQTFRIHFIAPATRLIDNNYMAKNSTAAVIISSTVAFLQSGLLHMCGSMTTIRQTKPTMQLIFFILQPLGILIQHFLAMGAKKYLPRASRRVSQVANLVFVIVWLTWTAKPFCDDLANGGIWMIEPVPFSILRVFGFGQPADDWWRWPANGWLMWHSAEHWWQSGLRI